MKLVSGLVLLTLAVASDAVADSDAWTTNGPPGGPNAVVVDPGDSSLVYTDVARSANSGATWQPYSIHSPTYAVAAGPSHTVYVGSGEIYLSQDAGATWALIYSGISNSPGVPFSGTVFNGLFVDPNSPSTLSGTATEFLFARPVNLLFERSSDGGRTWAALNVPNIGGFFSGVGSVAVDPKTPGTLYVSVSGSPGGAFKSTDFGDTWTQLPIPGFSVLAIDPQRPSTLYANSYASLVLMRSADGGATFQSVQSNFEISQLIVSPTDSNCLIGRSSGGVIESKDGGTSFQTITNNLVGPTSLAIDPSGGFLYAATPTGVYRSAVDSGALWLNAPHPFTVTLSAIDPHTGTTGPGVATQVNDLWGYFSIPAITNNPSNPEVFVKLLDGAAINGEYWFFYGGLTTLEYTLTVTDAATGKQKTYTKPAGSECGGADTAAFGP